MDLSRFGILIIEGILLFDYSDNAGLSLYLYRFVKVVIYSIFCILLIVK